MRSLRDWAEYLSSQERKVKAGKEGDRPAPPPAETKTKGQEPHQKRPPVVTTKPREESITQPKPGVLPGGRVIPPALRRDRRTDVPEFTDFIADKAEKPASKASSSPVAQGVAARKTTDLEPWVVVPAESPAADTDESRPTAEVVTQAPSVATTKRVRQPELFDEVSPVQQSTPKAPVATDTHKGKPRPESHESRPKPQSPKPAAPRREVTQPKTKTQKPTPVQITDPQEAFGSHTPISALMQYEGKEAAQHYYKKAREQGSFTETRMELIQRLVDPPLTLEEAARILNVCPTTVRRYTNKGLLTHHRTPGNQRRFRLSDVLSFMAQQGRLSRETQPSDQPGMDA